MSFQHEYPIYKTDHLYLAAFLACSGHEVVGTDREDGFRVSFMYQQTPELSSAVAGFMSGAAVPARQYAFEILKLKRTLNGGQQKVEKNKNHEQLAFKFDAAGGTRV